MKLQRTIGIDNLSRSTDAEATVLEFSLSSEAPFERYFGIEILSHADDAVDLSRLADGRHPLLVNHDTDRQVGVIEAAALKDKKLRVRARFGRSALAQEIAADVDDGIRSLVSVGYMIKEVEARELDAAGQMKVRKMTGEEFRREMSAKYGADFYRAGPSATRANEADASPPVYIVTRWQPFEGSIVAVPADVDVGVGRAAAAAQETPPAPEATPATSAANTPPPAIVTVHIERTRTMNEPTPADLERARTAGILALAEQYAKFLQPKDAAEAIRSGKTVEQFKDLILDRMQSNATATAGQLDMTPKEVQRYSLARALVASITGDWSKAGLEREASLATARVFGKSPEGFYVPLDYFRRDFNIGTSSEAGNLRETGLRTDLFSDALRNAMVLGGLGVRFLTGLSGNVDIPRKSTAGSVGMLSEIGSAAETSPATAKSSLSPKRIGAYVEVSKQALLQSALALEPMLRDDLLMGAARKIEDQVLNGVGSSNEMTGIRNTSSIGTVTAGTNGATLAWSHLVDLESACANVNAEPGLLAGYVVNTKTRGRAKQVTKSTYMPWLWQDGATPLNGHRVAVTNALPSNLTKGTSTTICSAALFSSDWSMQVIGLFGAPDIVVDPYSKADTGQVKITLNQFADTANRQPEAFAKIEDVLTA